MSINRMKIQLTNKGKLDMESILKKDIKNMTLVESFLYMIGIEVIKQSLLDLEDLRMMYGVQGYKIIQDLINEGKVYTQPIEWNEKDEA